MYSVCLSNLEMGVTLIMLPFSTFKILSGWLYRSITYSEMFLSPNQCLSFCIAQITDKDPQWFIVWVICMLPEIRCTGKISGSYAWNLVMGRLLPIKNLITTSIKEYLANRKRTHILLFSQYVYQRCLWNELHRQEETFYKPFSRKLSILS